MKQTRGAALDPETCAVLAAEAAAEKKAIDVMVLGVGDLLVVTDYFVLATGNTDRHVKTIAEEVEAKLKAEGKRLVGSEGEQEARWILLDFGDVVVHVFQPEERDFYRLERLWSEAPRVELPAHVVNASPAVEARSEGSADEAAGGSGLEGESASDGEPEEAEA